MSLSSEEGNSGGLLVSQVSATKMMGREESKNLTSLEGSLRHFGVRIFNYFSSSGMDHIRGDVFAVALFPSQTTDTSCSHILITRDVTFKMLITFSVAVSYQSCFHEYQQQITAPIFQAHTCC